MPNKIVHFEIPANDPEKVRGFYSTALGWTFMQSPTQENMPEYWMIQTGPEGKSMAGGMYRRQDSDEVVRFYVGDPDLDGAIARVQSAGGSLIQRFEIPGMVTGALLYDPEQNVFGIIKEEEVGRRRDGFGSQSGRRNRRPSSQGRGGKKKKKKSNSSSKKKRARGR